MRSTLPRGSKALQAELDVPLGGCSGPSRMLALVNLQPNALLGDFCAPVPAEGLREECVSVVERGGRRKRDSQRMEGVSQPGKRRGLSRGRTESAKYDDDGSELSIMSSSISGTATATATATGCWSGSRRQVDQTRGSRSEVMRRDSMRWNAAGWMDGGKLRGARCEVRGRRYQRRLLRGKGSVCRMLCRFRYIFRTQQSNLRGSLVDFSWLSPDGVLDLGVVGKVGSPAALGAGRV